MLKTILPKRLLSIFALISVAEVGNTLTTPVLTFVFFAASSSLFHDHTSFAVRSVFYGYALALQTLAGLAAHISIGIAADYFGRKAVMYLSLVGTIITGIGCGSGLLLGSPLLFIISLGFGALLYSVKPIGLAIVGDILAPKQRLLGMSSLQFFIAIGASLGPILGGFSAESSLTDTHFLLPFLICILLGIFGMLLIKMTMSETAAKQSLGQRPLKGLATILKNTQLWQLLLLLLLAQISWGSYYEFIGPVMKTVFKLTPSQVGLFIGIIALWLIIATSIIIPLLKRLLSNQKLLFIGGLLLLGGLLLSLGVSHYPSSHLAHILIWFAAAPVACGDVLLFCLLISSLSNLVTPDHQGKVMGSAYAMCILMWSLAAVIGGHLMAWNIYGALYFAPFGVGLLLLISLCSCRKLWFKQLLTGETK